MGEKPKKEKKEVKISLGTAIFLVAIIAILIIVVIAVILFDMHVKTMEDTTQNNVVAQNTVNTVENTTATEPKEEEISVDSDIVKNAFEKVAKGRDFIYKYANMESGNVPNELKLRLAWSNMEGEGLGKDLGESYFEQTGQNYYYTVEDFSKSLKNIMGEDATFENATFTARTDRFSTGDGLPKLIYNSEENRYETNEEFGGSIGGYVTQFITSATIQGDYLNIYVKPIFMCVNFDKYDDEIFDGYANYNYEIDTFSDKVVEKVDYIEAEEEPDFDVDKTKLNTYKYTFVKNGDNYYFDSLEKVQ